ncbi:MAG: hypothetical protein JOZ45_00495 [Acidobacteriaceae bacterium]|nr:hypothetical protein [Acidobacteriaceae bacterium]
MNKHSLAPFIGYLVIFYFTWTVVWVYGVYPWAVRNVGSTTLLYAVINIVSDFSFGFCRCSGIYAMWIELMLQST